MFVKRYTYQCVRCGVRFAALSPAMHLLTIGHPVHHCGGQARVVHVEDVEGGLVTARADAAQQVRADLRGRGRS